MIRRTLSMAILLLLSSPIAAQQAGDSPKTATPAEKKAAASDPAAKEPAAKEPLAKKAPVKEPGLQAELLKMADDDQKARMSMLKEFGEKGISLDDSKPPTNPLVILSMMLSAAKLEAVDKKDRTRLAEIIDKHGWPGKTLVGKEAASDAWLIVQHADADPAFQKRCLQLMKGLPKGEVEPQDVAYLTDRVLVADKKKQLYGTQLRSDGGKFKPLPIEDEANVDKRRAEIGLMPLAEYLKIAQKYYDEAAGKKKQPDGGGK